MSRRRDPHDGSGRSRPQGVDREGRVLADPDDDAERIFTTVPLENEDGEEYVISQQNVGHGEELGDGEFPSPSEPPSSVA